MNPSIVTDRVLQQVLVERIAQDTKWGEQNHPDGTGYDGSDRHADFWRQRCQDAFADGDGTWGHVLLEEVFEAIAEKDPAKLRAELVQVAAVAVAWVEAIDRRQAAAVRRTVGHATVLETANVYQARPGASSAPAVKPCPPGCIACATDESHDPQPTTAPHQDGAQP